MELTEEYKLKENKEYMKEEVSVDPLLDHLLQIGAVTEDDCQRVRKEATNRDKVDRLLRIIVLKPSGFEKLCKGLTDSGQKFITERIVNTEIDNEKLLKDDQDLRVKIKDVLMKFYIEDVESTVSAEEIDNDIDIEFSSAGYIWRNQMSLAENVIKEVFPKAKRKKKKRLHVFVGMKRIDDVSDEDTKMGDEEIGTSNNEYKGNFSAVGFSNISDGKSIEEKSASGICSLLRPRFILKGLDPCLLDIFEEEEVNGEIFKSLDITEMQNLLPNLSFGKRKTILLIRDELLKEEKEGVVFPDLDTHAEDKSEDYSLSCRDDTSLLDKFRETFRKFGVFTKEKDSYLQNAILITDRVPSKNFLHPVHKFVHDNIEEQNIPDWIIRNTIPFLFACLNDRMNGTIHFGVEEEQEENTLRGTVIGIRTNRKNITRQLYKGIRKYFYDEDFEVACKCILTPQFIRVMAEHPENSEMFLTDKFVLEIDVIPKHNYVQENAFFVKEKTGNFDNTDSALYRFKKDSNTSEKITVDQLRQYMDFKSKISLERKSQEERNSKGTIRQDLRQRFLDLFSAGNETLMEEIYPILFLSPLDSNTYGEFTAENFEFLTDIDPSVVFDFDSWSDGRGMYHFIEEDKENVVKVLTTDTFDKNSDEHVQKKDSFNHVLDDLRTSSVLPWVFCNGYKPLMKDPLKKLAWKQQRSEGLKEAIRFYHEEIPVERAIVIILLFSKNYDILLEAAEEALSKFQGKWIVLADNQQIVHHWKTELLRRESVDQKTLDTRCIIGIPWHHVNEMIKKVMGTKNIFACELPTSNGILCPLKEKTKNELLDLKILSASECECDHEMFYDKKRLEKHRKSVQENFFKGGEVSWWNLWFGDNHVLKRGIHPRLQDRITQACTGSENDEDTRVSIVNLIHQPGAGGTTSAKQALWENRKKYRCAITQRITDYTCDQIEKLRSYEESDSPLPPIILIDNDDEEKISNLIAQLENRARILSRRSDDPCKIFCVLLLCTRRTQLPTSVDDMSVQLRHELNKAELEWFKHKYEDLQQQFQDKSGVDPRLLISFNILKENFNKDYIKRAVQQFVDAVENEQEQNLLCYLSLMNTFDLDFQSVPISAFDPLMFIRNTTESYKYGSVSQRRKQSVKARWEANLSQSLLVLINRRARLDFGGHLKGFYIINQLFAKEIFTYILKKQRLTASKMMSKFLDSPLFHKYNRSYASLKKIVKDMLKKREVNSDGMKAKFSPLVMDILEKEDADCACFILEKGFEMSNDAMVAQQVSRLYIHTENWEKALKYAKIATNMKPDNSYLWDTYGQIYKTQLTKMYIECSEGRLSVSEKEVKNAFGLASKAIDKFKQEQNASEKENNARLNDAGYYAELRTVIGLLDLLRFFPGTSDKRVLRKFLVDSSFIPRDLVSLDGETVGTIKDFQFRTNILMRKIEEQNSQLKNDIFNNISLSKPILNQRNTLLYLHENLDNYFGEDTDNIPKNLSAQDKAAFVRRRVRRLGGNLLPTVLDLRNEPGKNTLRTMEGLLRHNIDSKFCSISDLLYITSISIVMNLNNENAQEQFKNVLIWSKQAIEISINNQEEHYLEIYLFVLLLHWPTENRYEYSSLLFPVQQLQDAMRRWKHAFFAKYPRQKEDGSPYRKRETTFFFLGRGKCFREIVYYEDLHEKHGSRYFRGDSIWQKQSVRDRLQRLQGTLKPHGLEIIVKLRSPNGNINILYIPTSLPIGQRTLWNKEVFFYLGFSWSGPKAFDVSQEETLPLKPSKHTKTAQGSSNRANQNRDRYHDVSTHEDFQRKLDDLNRSLRRITVQKRKSKNIREVQQEEKIKMEKEELMKRRDEFLSGAFQF